MKTLIIYSTTHGCTEKSANELKQYLGEDTELSNLKKDTKPRLEKYERIIVGGSIHAGQIQKRLKVFCNNNMEELISKELGLFICCMEEGETAQKQLQDAFPKELHKAAKVAACFGGEFNLDKMNFFEKLLVKKIAHIEKNISKINHKAIRNFSEELNKV